MTNDRKRQLDDTQEVARLLGSLPTAPDAWVEAAKEIPRTQRDLGDFERQTEEIIALTTAKTSFREACIADLEQALLAEGYEPDPALVDELRRRLDV